MSGRRGNLVLVMPMDVAREWIARGWADECPETAQAHATITRPANEGMLRKAAS